jgi:two-component system CheB/CheR fusion protein
MKKPKKTTTVKKGQASRKKTGTTSKQKTLKPKTFPIVAIGGSAGSFHAIEKFFTHMPPDTDMAFVVIMHLDPNHKGRVSELIQNFTPMPVTEAVDGMRVEPNRVYIIPPDKDMGIHNRQLLLLTPSKPKGRRMPIDYFFQSLAEDQWNKAIAIVLSGMGSDGETGVRMIKEKLGMTMVQDPDTAQYNSMPKSAISTNQVDYVLLPEEMPLKLIQYLKHPVLSDEPSEQAISDSRNGTAIQKILMMLRSQTAHDFSLYKKNTITRRIDRRIALHQLADYSHYVNYLRENPHELNALFNELLIGVTKFFRDAGAFEALRQKLFLSLKHKAEGDPVRVWVAGCSTGEEAYSIAILLMEYIESFGGKKAPKIQIFATDLDADAIEHGRQGIYLENIKADISPGRLEKYFVKKNNCYVVGKELREMIVFAQHNLIKDAPFTRLDLISCRNLMIYLTSELQKKIIPIFHYSINPKGLLFLGPAETIGGFSDLFQPLEPKWKIFERRDGVVLHNRMVDFPFNISRQQESQLLKSELPAKIQKKISLQATFDKLLLDNYTPASLLVSERGDILYVNGKTAKFLELSPGEAGMNVHKMVRQELRFALTNAMHQAKNHGGIVTLNNIRIKENNKPELINLRVIYLNEVTVQGLFLVIFEDMGPEPLARKKDTKKGGYDKEIVQDLEKELMYTKQQLSSTVEQMETSLEELKSTNEELQSTNEELQSTNEESLTTKEEMQSLNEELMTINLQYQNKTDELTQLNNDMKNLLDNTEIGTVFLDNNLDILRFTPQVTKLFNVITTDIGRPITHIVSNFEHQSLEQDIREVIEKLTVKELQVRTKKNEWYNIRIMPYRTMDNFISGAVLTLNRITMLKNLESQLNAVRKASKMIIDNIQNAALALDMDLKIIMANKLFLSHFRFREQDLFDKQFYEIVPEAWHGTQLDEFLDKVRTENGVLELPDPGHGKIKLIAKILRDEDNKEAAMIFLQIEEDKHEK